MNYRIIIFLIFGISALYLSGCDSATDSKSVSVTTPSLIEPADNDSNVVLAPTFKWSGSADKLQVAPNSTFSTPVYSSDITGTQFTMPSGYLDNYTIYYWRAGKTSGSTVYWSSTSFRFKTIKQ
jgi:hypothetical protein